MNTTIERMMQHGAHSMQRYVAEQDAEAPTDLIGAALFGENNAAEFKCLLDGEGAIDDLDRECQPTPPREASEFVVTLQKFINAAQACAREYFSNADYIENELPKVTMTESLLQMTLRICKSLKSTREEIFVEFQSWKQAPLSREQIAQQAIVVKNILAKDLQDLHVLAMSIRSQAEADSHKFGRANLLVGESATNIYEEFTCVADIAKELDEASKRA